MKNLALVLLAMGFCVALPAIDMDRSQARADVYASASLTAGIDFETLDSGIENVASLNLRFPLIDPATRRTEDQGDFYGWIELRNLSFRLYQTNLAGPAKPGDTATSLNNLQGQFGGNVADWLGNKPFVLDARIVYNPYPYTRMVYATLLSYVAQGGERIPGTGMSFNKAEAVTTPLFKTYDGITDLGEVRYEGLEDGGIVLTYQGKKLRTALKAFSHNETPNTAHIPAWLDHEDTTWAVGVDFRYDWMKDFLYLDLSGVYDFRDPEQNVNAGVATAVTVPLGWGPVVGFQVAPSADFRYGLAAQELIFDARLNLIGLLSDANKEDQSTMLMGSLYVGDDHDLEYAVIFTEPLAGGWVDDVEFGFMFSAMDILGNNPHPLPELPETGPSAQHIVNVGTRIGRSNVVKLEGQYQTGLAAYFASADERGLLLADDTDRARAVLTWTNTAIPNTRIIATWTTGNFLELSDMARPRAALGVLTVQTKVEF